ncbi:MAG: HAD family hydrolase [Bacteroidales bacterium]|nr:HAD family hydrolase [Bacteroidales bacterium]
MAALIFDFDGTLADTRAGILATAQEVLRRMGLPPADPVALAATIGLPLRENFTRGAGLPDEAADTAVTIYRSIFEEVGVPAITAFPGVAEVLEALASRGLPMAVATSRGQHSLELLMNRLGLDRHIPPAFCFGVETAARPKPAPDMVYVILGKLGAKPEETLVVGDTTFDIEMGRAAGCRTCGVTWGNQSADTLAGAYPDYIIDDIRKLL